MFGSIQINLDPMQIASWLGIVAGGLVGGKVALWGLSKVSFTLFRLCLAAVTVGLTSLAGYTACLWETDRAFDKGFTSYIRKAYQTDSPVRADAYLKQSMLYLQTKGLTEGFVGYGNVHGGDEDLGDFYSRLEDVSLLLAPAAKQVAVASLDQKSGIFVEDKDATWRDNLVRSGLVIPKYPRGQSSVLAKEKEDSMAIKEVVVPKGIAQQPYAAAFDIWGLISSLVTTAGVIGAALRWKTPAKIATT